VRFAQRRGDAHELIPLLANKRHVDGATKQRVDCAVGAGAIGYSFMSRLKDLKDQQLYRQ
jgi:hypothetical protein